MSNTKNKKGTKVSKAVLAMRREEAKSLKDVLGDKSSYKYTSSVNYK